jgi:hypothetical protein
VIFQRVEHLIMCCSGFLSFAFEQNRTICFSPPSNRDNIEIGRKGGIS